MHHPINNVLTKPYLFKKIVAILFFFTASFHLYAGDNNIPMLTRLVQQYTESEKEIVAALKENNQTILRQLVADDFELRNSNAIGEPVPRESWLNQSLKEAKNYPTTFEQMAVHDLSNVAVVSFRWQSQSIVDVWVKQQERWVLKIRYTTTATNDTSAAPDNATTVKKKY